MTVLSAIILFTSCQNEPTPVESNQTTLPKFTFLKGQHLCQLHLIFNLEDATNQDINVHRITVHGKMRELPGIISVVYAPEIEATFNASTDWAWTFS